MTNEVEHALSFGDPYRQAEFGRAYEEFVHAAEGLRELWETAFEACDTSTKEGRVLTFLARMALEDDFLAIILLCANGHSNGAKQVLRAMFEKVVTVGYLWKHPEEIRKFIDYSWIQRQKKLRRIGPALAGKLKNAGQESIKEIKENAKQLEDKYGDRGWSEVGIVSMAYDLGLSWRIVETGYYWGLVEAHATLEAIINRLKKDDDDSIWYEVLPALDESTVPLLTAHHLALVVIEFLAEHFGIDEVKGMLPEYWQEFAETWERVKMNMAQD